MNFLKSILVLSLFLLGNIGLSFAHALYIDTKAKANLGETHQVDVYYCEFADLTKEKVADWYSDVAQFKLWLIQPDGTRSQLKTAPKDDHLSAHFTPTSQGVYRLEIEHTAADVADGTAYQFNAFAQVVVENSTPSAAVETSAPDLTLVQLPSSFNNSTKQFKVFFKGNPKAGIAATLFLPSGKTKTLKSDAKGIISFTSSEKGLHFVEATTFHKNEAGKTTKEDYQAIWRAATQKLEL